eukprot:14119673-Alexandrium_andersonii.AAC.2
MELGAQQCKQQGWPDRHGMHAIAAQLPQVMGADVGAVGRRALVEQDVREVAVSHNQQVICGGENLPSDYDASVVRHMRNDAQPHEHIHKTCA